MDIEELLMTTCASNEQFAVNLWDWKGENSAFRYKNGGSIGPHMLAQVGNDYILGGNKDTQKLYLWQMNNQNPIEKYRFTLPKAASCLCICPHSHYLVAGIETDLYIWQLASGKLLNIQRKNYQQIEVVKFSNCGEYVVVGGQDGIVNTYRFVDLVSVDESCLPQTEIGQIEPLYTRNDHNLPVTDIHMGSFGRKSRFATCSLDHTVKIYQLLTGKLLLNIVYETGVCSVIFDSPCWNMFVGCFDGALRQFKLTEPPRETNCHVSNISNQNPAFIGHKTTIRSLSLNFSQTILASGDTDGIILIWEISSRQNLKRIENNSAISNLRFIVKHKNIGNENIQFEYALTDLEIELNTDMNFGIHVLGSSDNGYSREVAAEEKYLLEKFQEENRILRATNQQLYHYIKKLAFK